MSFPVCRNRSCGLAHDPRLRCEVAARLSSNRADPSVVATNEFVTTPAAVGNTVCNQTKGGGATGRWEKWREAHVEEYRARQREVMRKRRAAARAGFEKGGA